MPRSDPELALLQMLTELPPEAWPRCVEWMHTQLAARTAEVEALREAQRWIPTSESLPEPNEMVTFVSHAGNLFAGFRTGSDPRVRYWWVSGSYYLSSSEVVCWRRLFKPDRAALAPKEKNDG